MPIAAQGVARQFIACPDHSNSVRKSVSWLAPGDVCQYDVALKLWRRGVAFPEQTILAVETSGRSGSVALARGDRILCEAFFPSVMRHSAELFPTLAALLGQIGCTPPDISEVYVSVGPGSFTGIRLAVTVAKMMAFANSAKVVAVNSLQVAAQNAMDFSQQTGTECNHVGVVLDAKRGQFFAGFFHRTQNGWESSQPAQLAAAGDVVAMAEELAPVVHLLGEGLVYYSRQFTAGHIRILPEAYWQPRASAVFALGRRQALAGHYADPVSLVPTYLRSAIDTETPPRGTASP